jgi:hypothetical protein
MTAAEIRAQRPEAFAAQAEEIVNSDPVIRTYASSEWEELHDDGKLWICAIVRETLARAAENEENANAR